MICRSPHDSGSPGLRVHPTIAGRASATRGSTHAAPTEGRAESTRRTSGPDWEALRPRGFYALTGRRGLELALLLGTLPVALPLAAVVLIANACAFRSLRRAFFLQERVGERGRVFRIVKFRTMRGGDRDPGPDEARVTRLGRFLRSTHLDELPQLVNILRGEMTFIGPRPEMVEIEAWARREVPGFEHRLVLRPGITGFAQITQGYTVRDAAAYRRKHKINEVYRRNVRLSVDLEILVRTAIWMLRGRGWKWDQGASRVDAAPRVAADRPAPNADPVRPPAAAAHRTPPERGAVPPAPGPSPGRPQPSPRRAAWVGALKGALGTPEPGVGEPGERAA